MSHPRAQGCPCPSQGEVLEAAHLPFPHPPTDTLLPTPRLPRVCSVSGHRSPMVSGLQPPSAGSWENRGSRLGWSSSVPVAFATMQIPGLALHSGARDPATHGSMTATNCRTGLAGCVETQGLSNGTRTPTPRVSQEASRTAGA